jgi:hypothetical protein
MHLDDYAEVFAAAGRACLVYGHPGFGASDDAPAPGDRLVDGGLSLRAYERAVHPKKLVTVEGGHFDAYTGAGFEISSGAARDWFVEHLIDRTPS